MPVKRLDEDGNVVISGSNGCCKSCGNKQNNTEIIPKNVDNVDQELDESMSSQLNDQEEVD